MDITTMTDEQLKSLGYEQFKIAHAGLQAQNVINAIEQELAKRNQPAPKEGE